MSYIKPTSQDYKNYIVDSVNRLAEKYPCKKDHTHTSERYVFSNNGSLVLISVYEDQGGQIYIEKKGRKVFSKEYKHYSGLLKGVGNYRIQSNLG